MPVSISQKATTLSHKSMIKSKDASDLVAIAEKDEKITKAEATALDKIAKLPDSRFEKYSNGELVNSVDELRGSAEWSKELLGCKLDVKSTVPGLSVAFDKHVSVETSDYGNNYHRFLNLQMKGKKATRDGTLAFEYGGYKVSVKIKKGQSAESIFNAVERRVLAQQNGAMSIRGGYGSDRVLNPSIGFGIHRTSPMTPLERLQFERRMLEADLIEANMEEAPDVITDPIKEAIARLDAKIAKLEHDG
jgi:hypothetical protein